MRTRSVVPVFLCLALAACGDAGGGADAGDAAQRDGAADPADASPDGGSLDVPPRTIELGLVLVRSTASQHELYVSTTDPEEACTIERIAGCDFESCALLGPPHPSLGVVRVEGDLGQVSVTPGADGSYALRQSPGPLWTSGAPVRLVGEGADWPAFDQVLVGADEIEPAEAMVEVPAAAPLTVHWTGGTAARVVGAFAWSSRATGQNLSVRCYADAALGEVTFPTEILARVPRDMGLPVRLFGESRRVVLMGNREVRLLTRASDHTIDATFP